MVRAIINCKFPTEAVKLLNDCGFDTVSIPEAEYLNTPMSTHPDMLIFIGFGSIVCHEYYYKCNKSLIDSIAHNSSLELIVSCDEISSSYPLDARFNACVVGNSLLCNTKNVSWHILEAATKHGATIIHVNQGYTKCSTLIVDDENIITSDVGIHSAAQNSNINSLLISTGNVALDPYEYGFIGGASGTSSDTIYFCGNLDLHPDREKIIAFISERGKKCVFLPFEKLTDTGSILVI